LEIAADGVYMVWEGFGGEDGDERRHWWWWWWLRKEVGERKIARFGFLSLLHVPWLLAGFLTSPPHALLYDEKWYFFADSGDVRSLMLLATADYGCQSRG
jgi:hypothetical protein